MNFPANYIYFYQFFVNILVGMYDMGLTLNDTQVHLLAKLLDRDNSGEIDYTEISKGLQYAK